MTRRALIDTCIGLLPVAVALLLVAALFGAIPQDSIEAHRYADGVLAPRFHAAFNDWNYQHPQDNAGPWSHCQKFDAGDAKRWKLVRESFKALDEAMQRAGY